MYSAPPLKTSNLIGGDSVSYAPLAPPPVGYVMLTNELLDLRDEKYDDFVFRHNFVFRGKVRMPDGDVKYFSAPLVSTAELGRIAFWQDLWDQMRAYET